MNVKLFLLRVEFRIFGKCCYVDCQEEIKSPPGIYICESWKSTNQAAIRGLKPHEIFSLNATRCRTLRTKCFDAFKHSNHGHLSCAVFAVPLFTLLSEYSKQFYAAVAYAKRYVAPSSRIRLIRMINFLLTATIARLAPRRFFSVS